MRNRLNTMTFVELPYDRLRVASQRKRYAFISVGAVGQRLLNILLSLMVLALWFLRRMTVIALNCVGGIASSVLRRRSGATRRLDSSLRSHRTWRSQLPPRVLRAE